MRVRRRAEKDRSDRGGSAQIGQAPDRIRSADLHVEVPKGYYGACGSGCVDVYGLSGGEPVGFEDGVKTRIIVYEDVKGETVANDIGVSEASEFDGFMTEAMKVLDTVEWGGS
jgi:hypothetical protein